MSVLAGLMVAQLDSLQKLDSAAPALTVESSSVTTWMIAGVLVAGILAITFKTSKRNYMEKD